jgi:hypothetical protein
MFNPAGKPETDQLFPLAPPIPLIVALYEAPTVASGREVVVIAGNEVTGHSQITHPFELVPLLIASAHEG